MKEIDYDAPISDADRQMLIDHGWEISEDGRDARLYSEEWSCVQAAVFSTKWWIEENREDGARGHAEVAARRAG